MLALGMLQRIGWLVVILTFVALILAVTFGQTGEGSP